MRTEPALGILWLAALAVTGSAGCALSAQRPDTVTLTPGQDIQAVVENSPEGTRFSFEPGIYRQQTIYPKDRQQFIGQDGVVLSGAMELTTWRKDGSLWVAEDLPAPLPVAGSCDSGRDLCDRREDLFVDGRLYRRVGSLDELRPGTWHYENGHAYLADDPTGHAIELGVTPLAIGGDADNVVLRDLIVEKYAPAAQAAAIEFYDGEGWRLSNVTARWNHGGGLTFGSGTRVEGGSYSHNGQVGMKGTGENSTVEGVEIAFNNYAGYDPGWEAGGTKFYLANGLVVRDSCIHHNNGPGLWTDIDNIHVVYEGNRIFMNANDGIRHEISYDATIRNNIVAYNGKAFDVWHWGSQILIQNSQNVEVYDNIVGVADGFGNGISVIHQDRGVGVYGPWNAVDNDVHHNTIVHLGSTGANGVVKDTDDDWFWKEHDNRFDWNIYVVEDEATGHWDFNQSTETWADVQNLGYERNGQLVVEHRMPMQLSCDR